MPRPSILQRFRNPVEPLIDVGDLVLQSLDLRCHRLVHHTDRRSALRALNQRELLALADRREQREFGVLGKSGAVKFDRMEADFNESFRRIRRR